MSYYHAKTSAGIWRTARKREQLSKERYIFDRSYLNSISRELEIVNLDEKPINLNRIFIQSLPALRSNFSNLVNKYYRNMNSYPPDKCDEFLKALG